MERESTSCARSSLSKTCTKPSKVGHTAGSRSRGRGAKSGAHTRLRFQGIRCRWAHLQYRLRMEVGGQVRLRLHFDAGYVIAILYIVARLYRYTTPFFSGDED